MRFPRPWLRRGLPHAVLFTFLLQLAAPILQAQDSAPVTPWTFTRDTTHHGNAYQAYVEGHPLVPGERAIVLDVGRALFAEANQGGNVLVVDHHLDATDKPLMAQFSDGGANPRSTCEILESLKGVELVVDFLGASPEARRIRLVSHWPPDLDSVYSQRVVELITQLHGQGLSPTQIHEAIRNARAEGGTHDTRIPLEARQIAAIGESASLNDTGTFASRTGAYENSLSGLVEGIYLRGVNEGWTNAVITERSTRAMEWVSEGLAREGRPCTLETVTEFLAQRMDPSYRAAGVSEFYTREAELLRSSWLRDGYGQIADYAARFARGVETINVQPDGTRISLGEGSYLTRRTTLAPLADGTGFAPAELYLLELDTSVSRFNAIDKAPIHEVQRLNPDAILLIRSSNEVGPTTFLCSSGESRFRLNSYTLEQALRSAGPSNVINGSMYGDRILIINGDRSMNGNQLAEFFERAWRADSIYRENPSIRSQLEANPALVVEAQVRPNGELSLQLAERGKAPVEGSQITYTEQDLPPLRENAPAERGTYQEENYEENRGGRERQRPLTREVWRQTYTFAASFFLATFLERAIYEGFEGGFSWAVLQQAFEEALAATVRPETGVAFVSFAGTEFAVNRALAGEISGGFAASAAGKAMPFFVASIVTHHLLSKDYTSILDSDDTALSKIARCLRLTLSLEGWTSEAVVNILAQGAAFFAVQAAVNAVAAGSASVASFVSTPIGGIVVGTLTFLVGSLVAHGVHWLFGHVDLRYSFYESALHLEEAGWLARRAHGGQLQHVFDLASYYDAPETSLVMTGLEGNDTVAATSPFGPGGNSNFLFERFQMDMSPLNMEPSNLGSNGEADAATCLKLMCQPWDERRSRFQFYCMRRDERLEKLLEHHQKPIENEQKAIGDIRADLEALENPVDHDDWVCLFRVYPLGNDLFGERSLEDMAYTWIATVEEQELASCLAADPNLDVEAWRAERSQWRAAIFPDVLGMVEFEWTRRREGPWRDLSDVQAFEAACGVYRQWVGEVAGAYERSGADLNAHLQTIHEKTKDMLVGTPEGQESSRGRDTWQRQRIRLLRDWLPETYEGGHIAATAPSVRIHGSERQGRATEGLIDRCLQEWTWNDRFITTYLDPLGDLAEETRVEIGGESLSVAEVFRRRQKRILESLAGYVTALEFLFAQEEGELGLDGVLGGN